MKKPKDVAELASRLANAATAPLVVVTPVSAPVEAAAESETSSAPVGRGEAVAPPRKPRKPAARRTVAVFLRVPGQLFEQYDEEAVRRTKATGRGVTVQQVMLDRLQEAGSNA